MNRIPVGAYWGIGLTAVIAAAMEQKVLAFLLAAMAIAVYLAEWMTGE